MKNISRFTLVEVLAVMALIAILTAIGFGVYSYSKAKAKESSTEALLKQIDAGLGAFNTKAGYYPKSGSDFSVIKFRFASDGTVSEIDFGDTSTKLTYNASPSNKEERMKNERLETFTKSLDMEVVKNHLGNVTTDSNGNITYGELVDAWGKPIYYRSPGKFKKGGYDLVSAGPDGKFGSGNATTPENITDLKLFRETTGEHLCDDVFTF